MKRAIVACSFYDKEKGVFRYIGDAFDCPDERGAYLNSLGLVWLKDIPSEKPKKAKKTVSKK